MNNAVGACMTSRPIRRIIAAARITALGTIAGACGSDGPTPPGGADVLIASKVAVLAVAVATSGEGHGFFDNFVECPRRGVIDYTNTPTGRRATFSGCDAGDGVVISGDAQIAWTTPSGDRTRITSLDITGTLSASIGGATPKSIGHVTVTGIGFGGATEPTVERLVTGPVRVTAFGGATALDARATPAAVFTPALTIDALPNASSSLDALGESDLKRIAFSGALRLAAFLFDETLEIQRGDHQHQLSCGTTRVVADLATLLPHLENTWPGACAIDRGLFATGTFTQDWTEFDARTGRLTMVMSGTLTVGGGVPRVALTRVEWSMSGLTTLPSTARVSGRLVAGSQSRTFSFDVPIDD
jgi:hypothetical protein